MKTRITMKQMVKEIFFTYTNGRRTAENFMDGMYIIETVPTFYYRWALLLHYTQWQNGEKTTQQVIEKWYKDARMGEDNRSKLLAACLAKFMV